MKSIITILLLIAAIGVGCKDPILTIDYKKENNLKLKVLITNYKDKVIMYPDSIALRDSANKYCYIINFLNGY